MIRIKHRIILIGLGLVFFFLALEVSLRLAGSIYYKTWMFSGSKASGYGKGAVKILCLGDSFTFGHGAEKGKSYPVQLQRMLDENRQDKKFVVYNVGVPGYNSSMVLKRLVKNLNKYRPDIVLLLIGSNDGTVLEDSNYYLLKRPAAGAMADLCLKLDIFFSKFRSYKLIRAITLNLKNRFSPEFNISDIKFENKQNEYELGSHMSRAPEKNAVNEKKNAYLEKVESLWGERRFSEAEKAIKESPGGYDPRSIRECLLLSNIYLEQEKYKLAISAMADYMKNNPRDAEVLFTLGKIYYMQGKSNPSQRREKFEQAARMFKESLLYADPGGLWLKGQIYGYLAKLYFDRGENALAKEM
ncbi:MAG: GDSL-type esterase/lipase family protein, partial [Candidatus Omnitrophica bacterium]|nr:GDSL-type esterase/lipase family protein [Candidatus Omnitrophota bacterium]